MANFKDAADEKAYEEDYEIRAEQHRKEGKEYRDNGVDDSLFKKLHYKVRVAGFGSAVATVRAIAGYAGQTDVKKLQDWMDSETVDMAFRAFHDIEVTKCELLMPHSRIFCQIGSCFPSHTRYLCHFEVVHFLNFAVTFDQTAVSLHLTLSA